MSRDLKKMSKTNKYVREDFSKHRDLKCRSPGVGCIRQFQGRKRKTVCLEQKERGEEW